MLFTLVSHNMVQYNMVCSSVVFLVFTQVTSALTTVAIRHVGAQTNALNLRDHSEKVSLNRFFALFCAVEVKVTEIN